MTTKKSVTKKVIKQVNDVVLMKGDKIAAKTAAKTTGRPKIKGREYLIKDVKPFNGKIAKQAESIWYYAKQKTEEIVWISEAKLQTLVKEAASNGVLKTKQDPWRIFQYYRAQLISAGSLKMRNAE